VDEIDDDDLSTCKSSPSSYVEIILPIGGLSEEREIGIVIIIERRLLEECANIS
jgi:hypothetical protein